MEARLKQRTVGAVTFAAIAIIVLPMLLDGSSSDRERVVTSIPAAPDIPITEISVADIRDRMNASERASTARLPREIVDDSPSLDAEPFTLDQNKLPVSWTLQVASFKEQDNAVRLRQQLRDNGNHSYILHADTSGGETYRVFVGPMIDRDALLEIATKIEVDFKLKGQLRRYSVADDLGQLGGGES